MNWSSEGRIKSVQSKITLRQVCQSTDIFVFMYQLLTSVAYSHKNNFLCVNIKVRLHANGATTSSMAVSEF